MRPVLNAVQLTSLLTAFWRNCEYKSALPLCKDPYATVLLDELLPAQKRVQFEQSPLHSAGLEILACRTRALDDWLMEGGVKGIEQVVFLGAGMDTRAYRLGLGKDTTVFEVEKDLTVLKAKHETLQRSGITPMVKDILQIGADVTHTEDLKRKLHMHGLQPNKKTSWVAEGLLEYLPLAAQGRLFGAMRDAGGEGSRVGMQVLDPSFGEFVTSLGVDLPYQELASVGFTTEEMRRTGWEVDTVWDQAEFGRVYGRRPHGGFRLVFGKTASGCASE